MPTATHVEHHFTASETVRDIVIGMSDGLTVPFALAAGLAGAIDATHIIVTAGVAEIAAGSIAMGLGGYLATRGDAEHYESERTREQWEVDNKPEVEMQEVREAFIEYGLSEKETEPIVQALKARPQAWIDFMMRFELGLEKPEPTRARNSALTIALSYIAGGFIPLAPYIFLQHAQHAFAISVGVTLAALAVFGGIKGHFTGTSPIRSGLQTTLIGGIAAAAAYGLAKLVGGA
ncbi:MAG TPA: VIT1/CCC1 transporter family protein [Planctomycetota bacterium]|jgi:VIT1/CCC1 family predicted Fe2+/Mn2+ transporter